MRTLASLLAVAAIATFGFTTPASAGHVTEPVVIDIDIKPFSDPNSINTHRKKGVVPVAICNGDPVVNSVTIDDDTDPDGFSGATTNIDVSTIEFAFDSGGTMLGTGTASPKHDLADADVLGEHMTEFVDTGDRFGEGTDPDTLILLDAPECTGSPVGADLVVHFPQMDTGLAPGDTEACVTLVLNDGTHDINVIGCDAVRIVK